MNWILRIALLLVPVLSLAQPYGNEWIDYSRPYYKFKVAKEGIYRIDSLALANAGIPIGTIDPQTISIYNRESEVALYVEGEDDGIFNGADFIEFFGQKNDGWFDTQIYDEPESQANIDYSLFNDTIYYYLTWGAETNPKRAVIENDTNFASYTPLDWFWAVSRKNVVTNYYPGFQDINGLSLPYYTEGEGWFSARFAKRGARQYSVPTKYPYTGPDAPDALVSTANASTNNSYNGILPNHHIQVHYGNPATTLAIDSIFTGYQLNNLSFTIPPSSIHASRTFIRTGSVDDLPIPDPNYPDYNAVAFVQIKYAHEMNLGNAVSMHMYVPFNSNGSKNYLEWNSFQGSSPIMYVLNDTVKRLRPLSTGASDEVLIPNISSGIESHCYLHKRNTEIEVTNIIPATPTTYFTDLQAQSPDSAFVIITAQKFLNEALAYATYRGANPYNQYETLVVTVEELFDQYGGGIPHHVMAIRKFSEMMLNEWSTDPKYLFLIGKSIMQAENAGGTVGSRKGSNYYKNDLIPTYGFPPSDIMITSGLNGTLLEPAIPIGRLSAQHPVEVMDYLGKVMVHESNAPGEWMKRVLHFRGGASALEWSLFDYYLSQYEAIIQDTCFGGSVHTFKKNSSNIIEQQLSDSISWLVNNGVSLMTFFGHASGSGFDINIDIPDNYDWNGHYPLMIGNSCFTGNIHLKNSISTSEQFVIAGGAKGAIGFLASVDAAVAQYLDPYSNAYYRSLSVENYGKGLGDHCKFAIEQTQGNGTNFNAINNNLTFTLHADPSIVLNAHAKPDMSVESEDIRFIPEEVNPQAESFSVQVIVKNIGKSATESFDVKLRRSYPSGGDTTYIQTLQGINNQETLLFTIPVNAVNGGIGINRFEVSIDLSPDVIDELDNFNNNVASKLLFINSGVLIPAWPYEYQVVPDPTVTLKASTGDPFAPQRDYIMQIDTTDLFNSPVLESTLINSSGGVVTWDPQTIFHLNNFEDSTVFFWRAGPDSTSSQDYIWSESSFQYIANREGWGQAHFYQFQHNGYDQVIYNRPELEYDFNTGARAVRCNVNGNAQAGAYHLTQWLIDLVWQDGDGCSTTPAFHVAVIDPSTFEPWGTSWHGQNPDHSFGNVNDDVSCRNRIEKYFIFRQKNEDQMNGMLDMLQNHVPDGHYLLVYTWQYLNRHGVEDVNSGNNQFLIPELESLGADSIALIPDSVPYIFFVRKGDLNSAQQVYGQTINDDIVLDVEVQLSGKEGQMKSTIAGPSSNWKGLYWSQHAQEQPTVDSTRVKLYGIGLNGSEQEFVSVDVDVDSVPQLYNYIDAQRFPYVRLEAYLADETSDATPAQIDRWHLLHDPVPEAALDPLVGFYNSEDTVFGGQDMSIGVGIHNISPYDMDSLLVSYWIEDRFNNIHVLPYDRQGPLPSGGVLYDTITFNTTSLAGVNAFWVEVNPVDPNTGYYDQLEQYHFNNIGNLRFEVINDITNPVLDVTFDGLHIIDGEIISAKPEITVRLDDENEWLIMEDIADTALFKFYLTYPDGVIEQIYFQDGQGTEFMQFEPATNQENVAHIYFRPVFDQDGEHTLQIRASDLSNNASGDLDFKIRFEVIQRSTITDVLNYPNPFTTKTQFVFTVTGSEAPTYMQIQIMTITGRVVREITNFELGPIRVGRNVTDFYWDGTDQYGDRLAQGVYLYKVTAKLHGEEIEYRESGASSYFKNGIGKMYLLK